MNGKIRTKAKGLATKVNLLEYATDLLAWLLVEHPKIIIEFSEARKDE